MKYSYVRILNLLFILLSAGFALALLFYSGLLFFVYVGTLPLALLVMWFATRLSRSKPEAENSSDTQETQLKRKLRAKFWKTLYLELATLFIWTVLLASLLVFEVELPDYTALILGVAFLGTWVVFLVSLAKICRILLLLRSITKFPRWSLAIGGVSIILLICNLLLSIIALFLFRNFIRSPYIPSDAFRVSYRAKIFIGESDTFRINEHYEIKPQGSYTIIHIEEIESGKIPDTNIEMQEKFDGGNYEKVPLEGIRVDFNRNLSSSKERLGWLRSKMILPFPGIRLKAKDVRPRSSNDTKVEDDTKIEDQSHNVFTVSRDSQIDSKIEIEMPKNSFLVSYPKGEFISLPEKDVITISSFPDEIQIYYLQHLRLKVIRDIFSQSSNYDAYLSVLAFLFWPASVIVVGIFHQKLANRILDLISRLFQRKKKKAVGFHP